MLRGSPCPPSWQMDGCISFYRRRIVGPLNTVWRGREWCQSSLVAQLQREPNISSSALGLNVGKIVTFIKANFTFGIDESFPWSRVWRWQLLFNFGNVFWMQVVKQTLANQIVLMVQNKSICIKVKTLPFQSNEITFKKVYLSVIQNFINRLRDEENLSTITTNYKEEAIGSLQREKEGEFLSRSDKFSTRSILKSLGVEILNTPLKSSALIHHPTRMLVYSLLLCMGWWPLQEKEKQKSQAWLNVEKVWF